MRSTRPKPLHLLCGRAMVLYVLDSLAELRDPPRRSSSSGHGAERVTKKLQEDRARRRPRLRRAARAAGHRRRRQRRPHRLPRRRARRRRRRRAGAAGRHAAAAARHHRRARRRPPRAPTRRARCSPPGVDDPTGYGRVVRGKDDRVRPHRRAGRRHRRGARASTRSTPRSTASGAAVLGAGAAPPQPRERAGRVLPDRRGRGARTTPGYPVVSAVVADDARRDPGRQRPRPAGRRPRPSCGDAPTTAGCARASPCSTPNAPTSTPPSSSPPTSRSSPARSCRARCVIGAGAELGPDTRLVDCVVGAGAVVEQTVGPRCRGRRGRRTWARSPCSSRAAASPCGRPARAVLHCRLHLRRPEAAGRSQRRGTSMELVTKKRLHLVSGRANLPLAEEIAERLGVALGRRQPGRVRQRRAALPLRRVRAGHRRLHHPDATRPPRACRSTTRSWSS